MRLCTVELDLGGGDRLGAELVLEPADAHAVAAAVTALAEHEERGDAADAVGGADRLGQHDERRAVGVGGEPLEPGDPPRVTVWRRRRLQLGEVGPARALGQHLRRLAGVLTGGEQLAHTLLDVVGSELVGEPHDHVATRAERAHHADLRLVEQVHPRRRQRRRLHTGLPRLVAERRRGEVVLDQVAARRLERRRHHDLADVAPPPVVLLQPRRMAVGLLGPLGDRPAHQRTELLEARCRPRQAVGTEVLTQHELQRRI